MLRLFTTDSLFTQQPLTQVLLEADRDFLFAVKDNQPDLHEALQANFREPPSSPPTSKPKRIRAGLPNQHHPRIAVRRPWTKIIRTIHGTRETRWVVTCR